MARGIALVIAFICAPFVDTAGEYTAGDLTPKPPYILVSTHRVSPEADRVPNSLSGLNPHEVVVMAGPSEKQKAVITRYFVVPGEQAERQAARDTP